MNSRYFVVIKNRLYRRRIDGILHRCVISKKVLLIMVACHDNVCSSYFLDQFISKKVLRAGNYWPTFFQDVHDYVKKCDACQYYIWNDLCMELLFYIFLPFLPFKKSSINYVIYGVWLENAPGT